jgi:hypothetical protein
MPYNRTLCPVLGVPWWVSNRGQCGSPQRIRSLDSDLASHRADITKLIERDTAQLLELTGVGSREPRACSSPGHIRVSSAHRKRWPGEPEPTQSRHRPATRSGASNRPIATAGMSVDPITQAAVARRRAAGRSTKEIMPPSSTATVPCPGCRIPESASRTNREAAWQVRRLRFPVS